ncbi:protein-disulfide reductase DsbD [Halopseudomonas pelagia]|uniref:Thiol:disulfide interchange protein DsbD n=1 Tax=Halopseudomonas pelagia TaxID=553151 RepID=A0AA92EJZ0_9GAMM|nr:protein-disulfide reductase DsbD [Halopseudomonas pelagia]PCC99937.1 thiol:disulfide interchange protein [Halopseudomonas pelagia]QFY56201.1 protein-disulfide reductase DsbD [Halopseudomonas pelagia]
MRWRYVLVLPCLLVWSSLAFALVSLSSGDGSDSEFLPVEEAFELVVGESTDGKTQLTWHIAPGYYLYQQRLTFSGLDQEFHPALPAGLPHSDEFFGESEIYRDSLQLTVPPGYSGQFTVAWQGCADAGLCYPPQSLDIGTADEAAADAPEAQNSLAQAEDQRMASQLHEWSLPLALALFFGLGLLLAFTPCSLPMLPILAGLVVGSGATPRRGLMLASVYVISMAMVYAALGMLAAMLGGNLQAMLQQPWLLGAFAGLFVLLALPMFGIFELQLPAFVRDKLDQAGRKQTGGHLGGAAMLGLFSGLLVGPCMTAPLAGALLYISQTGDILQGGLALFALGIGMGIPLLLVVTLGTRFLPRPGPWMNQIKVVFGFVFLASALLIVRPALDESLWLGLFAVLLLGATATIMQTARHSTHSAILHTLAALAGVWSLTLLLGAAGGATNPWQPLTVYTASAIGAPAESHMDAFTTLDTTAELDQQLADASAAGKWVLVDYYADWCVSCKVMEQQIFGRTDVMASLEGVRLLRPDVTSNSLESRQLLSRYEIHGPPTLLWIGPDGRERRANRITGEVNAEEFLQKWQTTKEDG